MPQSLARILVHTIFSTKNRQPVLADPTLRAELHSWMGGVSEKLGSIPIQIGGVADHVHLLTTLSRSMSPAEFVKESKRVATDWLRKQNEQLAQFRWQAGYGMFSVSESNKDEVIRYIQDQEEHHKKVTFKEEFRQFCRKHQLEIDERYVWD